MCTYTVDRELPHAATPAAVVITHGWGGSPQEWSAIATRLTEAGHEVHCVDHRGWRPTPRQAAWQLLGRCARMRAGERALLLIGHSLGAAVSVLAARYCVPNAVLALAPTTLIPGTGRAARDLPGQLTVAVGTADMLTGPTGDAARLATAASTTVQWLPGVTHAGFLTPSGDLLGRRMRALESWTATRRGQAVAPPQRQVETVSAFIEKWVEQACTVGAGRAPALADGART